MKKIFATGVIAFVSTLPMFAAAQTTPATNNSALIAALEQLVQILTQEIQQILAQQQQQTQLQQQLVQNQTTQSQQIQQIAQNTKVTAQNTTPVAAPQPTPAPQSTPAPEPIDKSAVIITEKASGAITADMPHGSFSFWVGVLDSNGKNIQNASITMNAPGNMEGANGSCAPSAAGYPGCNDSGGLYTRTANQQSTTNAGDWTGAFVYYPTTAGTKTVTFTSGNLSNSITVVAP